MHGLICIDAGEIINTNHQFVHTKERPEGDFAIITLPPELWNSEA